MTIPAAGVVKMSDLRTEYMPVGSNQNVLLSSFYRGNASGFVRKNAANNAAVNRSAAIPESGIIKLSQFRGQSTGWDYTNAAVITDALMATPFGDDWAVNWPKKYTNNGTIGGIRGVSWAFRIEGGAGKLEFVNNSEVQGGYGAPNSGGGYHAVHINSPVRVYITNNSAFRGGGGAGGIGGAGGQGGQGYYTATGTESPAYQIQYNEIFIGAGGDHGITKVWWAGSKIWDNYAPPYTAIGISGYTYYQGALVVDYGSSQHYYVYRQWQYNVVTTGGAGGGGGNGGRGQGYGYANTAGNPGAGGAAGGTNSGTGGTGGTGGSGGVWGSVGNTGNTGAIGGYGNYSGWGGPGYGGAVGGAAGYAIHAETAWTSVVNGTRQGPVGPVAATAG